MRGVVSELLEAVGRPTAEADSMAVAIDALTDGLWLRLYLSSGTMESAEALQVTARILAATIPERAEAFRRGLCDG